MFAGVPLCSGGELGMDWESRYGGIKGVNLKAGRHFHKPVTDLIKDDLAR